MKLKDAERTRFSLKEQYAKACPNCGRLHRVFSDGIKSNEAPLTEYILEYLTTIHIVCECDELIEFEIVSGKLI